MLVIMFFYIQIDIKVIKMCWFPILAILAEPILKITFKYLGKFVKRKKLYRNHY